MRIQLAGSDGRLARRISDLAAGRAAAATPRDAATVVLLRVPPQAAAPGSLPPAGGDVEVLMLRRTAAMKFAPGAHVFPGGSVDPADFGADVGWHGPDPAEFGARLGAPPELARALACAAARETFEESGVLLAGTPDGALAVPAGTTWAADRMALAAGALAFGELLSRRGLVLRADLLTPWARWITPEGEPRRFDARFFVAALPAGQRAVGHAAEADQVAWVRPAAAIDTARAGKISLLPPTAVTLHEVATAVAAGEGITGILRQRRVIEPVRPRLVLADGQPWLLIPEEVRYPL